MMPGTFGVKIQHFQQRLTRLDKEPLGKAALVIILFLDLFILVSIFDGLGAHTAQLTSPSEYIPGLCRDMVLDEDWNETNRLDKLARLVSQYRNSYFRLDLRAERETMHAVCDPMVRTYRDIRDDKALSRDLDMLVKLDGETRDLRAGQGRVKGTYDTALLEAITRKEAQESRVATLRQEIADMTVAMEELVRRERLLRESLEQDERIRKLYALVEGVSGADRDLLREDLRRLNFWYPVKKLGMDMLFLLPLFLVFYAWNARSIARDRPFQTLVSSHLLVVALVPVFFKLIELVYDILPRKLLRHLVELLESLRLVAIWHYLLIGVAVLAALALIYLFQRKLFSREKLMQRRIAKGQCQQCGLKLASDIRYCTACGMDQYRSCASCNELTHVYGKYCRACGRGVL
ncbi:MAG: zinc ribbon domain-containing protein [Gammaproteobacteria bacterium]